MTLRRNQNVVGRLREWQYWNQVYGRAWAWLNALGLYRRRT